MASQRRASLRSGDSDNGHQAGVSRRLQLGVRGLLATVPRLAVMRAPPVVRQRYRPGRGTIQLAAPGVQAVLLGQPSLDLLCDKTLLYVERNGELVWGG